MIDHDIIREIVAEQRREQGLPPTITDPAALRVLVSLIFPAGVKR